MFRFCCLLASVLLWGAALYAQNCGGNLGENIFTAGDFGSGADNILQADPGIAPGFTYQTSPPPNDGFYTITKDMRPWNNPWGDWRAFPDNSNDPNGYMMVVNAAFEPGLFYEQRVTGLCDGTEYQFSADITNIYFSGRNGILPNVSFLIDGEELFTTGPIPENERWNTYAFAFATRSGQTSVTLALRNNAPGGIGNDLAIDNISFRACGPQASIVGGETVRICEDGEPETLVASVVGDQYASPAVQWQRSSDAGRTWEDIAEANDLTYVHTEPASGFYHYRFLLANGTENLANAKCRVVSDRKIVEVVPKRYAIADTVCAGLSTSIGAAEYATTGTYTDTLRSSLGCDSIVTLRLVVLPDPGLQAVVLTANPTCDYLSDGSLNFTGVTNAALPVEFYFRDTLRGNRRLFPNLGAGSYAYRFVDRYGCSVLASAQVTAPPPFTVDLGADQTVSLGDEVRIRVRGSEEIVSFSWSPEEVTDCSTACSTLELRPTASLTLALEAGSDRGCLARDSVRILVSQDRKVFIPNAFSPNNDGVNDHFLVYGGLPNVDVVLRLQVFDRWGSTVFTGLNVAPNDPAGAWDGLIDGLPAPAGLYSYLAEVRFLDGTTLVYRGSLAVTR